MYVAITRARKRLYMSFAQTRMLHGQTRYGMRSRFIEELPEPAIKWLTPRLLVGLDGRTHGIWWRSTRPSDHCQKGPGRRQSLPVHRHQRLPLALSLSAIINNDGAILRTRLCSEEKLLERSAE